MHSLYRLSRIVIKLKSVQLSEKLIHRPSRLKLFFKYEFSSSVSAADEQKLVDKLPDETSDQKKISEGICIPFEPNELNSYTNHVEQPTSVYSKNELLNPTTVTQIALPLEKSDVIDAFKSIETEIEKSETCGESHFIDDIAPPLPTSFNLAAYANRSPTLQKLIELGVDLSRFEEKAELAKFIMRLDFETDMKPHIKFLYDVGVPADELGKFLTKNPLIFKECLDDLQIRINYLESKKFNETAIARIITRNPFHLMMDTKSVDHRLGFFQTTFGLSGNEVRFVITKHPKLVSYAYVKLSEKVFTIKEEMEFSDQEMKQLLLLKPKIFMLSRVHLIQRFNIVHNEMGISQKDILKFPGVLLKRGFLLDQRHKYLVKLGRAQYDPAKPGYVSLMDIAATTDVEFCKICSKTSVVEYNKFLKTL